MLELPQELLVLQELLDFLLQIGTPFSELIPSLLFCQNRNSLLVVMDWLRGLECASLSRSTDYVPVPVRLLLRKLVSEASRLLCSLYRGQELIELF